MACGCFSFKHLTRKLFATELVRYLAIVLPLSLAVWRASDYPENSLKLGVTEISLMIAAGTLAVYLPLKCLCKQKFMERAREGYGWRPSIVIYILLCGLPSMVVLSMAIASNNQLDTRGISSDNSTQSPVTQLDTRGISSDNSTQSPVTQLETRGISSDNSTQIPVTQLDTRGISSDDSTQSPVTQDSAPNGIDPEALMVIQFIVVGLTVTEWVAKARERELTTDLLAASAADFFFAFDLFEFFEIQLHGDKIWSSDVWVYVVFAFGWLSMCKYIPNMPSSSTFEEECRRRVVTGILTGMLCQDLPFFIIRMVTLITHGATVADFFYPVKNFVLVVINIWQLRILCCGNAE